jgi:S1-C subfamily serine protease
MSPALAMILAAGMTVGDGPAKVSGEVKDETARMKAAIWASFGLKLRPVDREAVWEIIPHLRGGLEVTAVRPNGPTDRAGIRQGDILIALGGWEMLSVDHVARVLNRCGQMPLMPLRFFVVRDKQFLEGRIKLD